jgi:hypothetical protein
MRYFLKFDQNIHYRFLCRYHSVHPQIFINSTLLRFDGFRFSLMVNPFLYQFPRDSKFIPQFDFQLTLLLKCLLVSIEVKNKNVSASMRFVFSGNIFLYFVDTIWKLIYCQLILILLIECACNRHNTDYHCPLYNN